MKKVFIGLNQDKDLVVQDAAYIEDGFYIRELLCGGFEIRLIPQYGGKESSEGTYATLREALKALDKFQY